MPELPEVETVRRVLSFKIINKKIRDVKILKQKLFQGNPKEIIGSKIVAIDRRAKVLFIKLSNGKFLMVHLKMSGQLVWVSKAGERVSLGHPIPFSDNNLPGKTTHIIFSIDGGKLFYNDLRQFGWIKLVDQKTVKKEWKKFGPEPFSKEFSKDYLKKIFSRSKKAIKLFLLDQNKIAGLGNIYANEALFEAGINPLKPTNSLEEKEIDKLRRAIIKILKEGIKYKGSSAADEAYIQPTGEKGAYQEHFRVYQKQGQKCQKCNTLIKKVKIGGRGTFYCPKCQH